ncbi:hypothetical protein SDC9_142736 [bioreactor metagenome]|uniref:Uncharacterized protein n=1 Tax=bioreactor metagenome TaxID=1076179 RepID=A0A645E1Z1_9ZZZZ
MVQVIGHGETHAEHPVQVERVFQVRRVAPFQCAVAEKSVAFDSGQVGDLRGGRDDALLRLVRRFEAGEEFAEIPGRRGRNAETSAALRFGGDVAFPGVKHPVQVVFQLPVQRSLSFPVAGVEVFDQKFGCLPFRVKPELFARFRRDFQNPGPGVIAARRFLQRDRVEGDVGVSAVPEFQQETARKFLAPPGLITLDLRQVDGIALPVGRQPDARGIDLQLLSRFRGFRGK